MLLTDPPLPPPSGLRQPFPGNARNSAARSTPISISFFSCARAPRAGPSYYYCNCKEGKKDPAQFRDFQGVTGPVEGSLASNLNSAGQHSRVSRKGEKSFRTTPGGLGGALAGGSFQKGGDFACRGSAPPAMPRLRGSVKSKLLFRI